MRRSMGVSIFVASLCVGLAAGPVAAEPGRVTHRELFDSGSARVRGICSFPVVIAWETLHEFSARFTSSEPVGADQVWGRHWVRGVDTWSNPATGRTLTVRYAGPLIRKDFDYHFTYDAEGDRFGYFTAVDHYSGNYVGTAPGWGTVILDAGHAVAYHTSFYVDDVRVGRIDTFAFTAGPGFDTAELCAYLAG